MKNLVLALLVTFLFSCKKQDAEPVISAELLAGTSQKAWFIKDITNSDPTFAVWATQPTCVKDDEWVFYTDKRMQQNEGASKCTPQDPQIYVNGTWELFVDSKTLRLNRSNIVSFTIEKLTENEMILKNGASKYMFTKK